MKVIFKKFEELTVDELYEILKLRFEIFVIEQNCIYQDLDDIDKIATHLMIKKNEKIVAYLRLIPENIKYKEVSLGRVVVKSTERKNKLGSVLLENAINYFKNNNKNEIRISAQAHLTTFYGNYGFKRVSENYIEDDIPHCEMLILDNTKKEY